MEPKLTPSDRLISSSFAIRIMPSTAALHAPEMIAFGTKSALLNLIDSKKAVVR